MQVSERTLEHIAFCPARTLFIFDLNYFDLKTDYEDCVTLCNIFHSCSSSRDSGHIHSSGVLRASARICVCVCLFVCLFVGLYDTVCWPTWSQPSILRSETGCDDVRTEPKGLQSYWRSGDENLLRIYRLAVRKLSFWITFMNFLTYLRIVMKGKCI
jgi:hypothetical protein